MSAPLRQEYAGDFVAQLAAYVYLHILLGICMRGGSYARMLRLQHTPLHIICCIVADMHIITTKQHMLMRQRTPLHVTSCAWAFTVSAVPFATQHASMLSASAHMF